MKESPTLYEAGGNATQHSQRSIWLYLERGLVDVPFEAATLYQESNCQHTGKLGGAVCTGLVTKAWFVSSKRNNPDAHLWVGWLYTL